MEYRSGGTGGPHPGVDIFPDLSPRAKPYCGVKCSQGLHFPATPFIGKQDCSSTSPEPNEVMRPSPLLTNYQLSSPPYLTNKGASSLDKATPGGSFLPTWSY